MLTDIGYISPGWIWVALTIIFALIEVFTLGLTTIWFALSALVMVFLSFLPIPLPVQVLVFLVLAALFLIFTRPLALRKFKTGGIKTNVESLTGMRALVTRAVGEFEKGEVQIHGQIWSASSHDNKAIPKGTRCEVVAIQGVRAIVRPLGDGGADTSHTQSEV